LLKLGVIGYPIGHSLSPRMHNAALRALSLDGEYSAIAVESAGLHKTLRGLFAQGFDGLNVTIPHKQAVLPLMDELANSARVIGAVNTILKQDGHLVGHNTDAAGFTRGLTDAGFNPAGAKVLVLGAGGAARAVVYALSDARASVVIWNRTHERAERLALEFGADAFDRLPIATLGMFDLIVNTTSVGMSPHPDDTPLQFPRGECPPQWVYDLVYSPRETRFLREARAAGAVTIGGLEMLVYQGAEAFTLWTGRAAPVEVMRNAIFDS
jgi:shikimate dehydrogenase